MSKIGWLFLMSLSCWAETAPPLPPPVAQPKRQILSAPSWRNTVEKRNAPFRLMAFGNLDGLMGQISGVDTATKGMAWGAGLGIRYLPVSKFRVLAAPHYCSLRIGRTTSASNESVNYDQYFKYVGLMTMAQFQVLGNSGSRADALPAWAEIGVDYLHPLSATQEASFGGGPITFNAPRMVLGIAGLSGDVEMDFIGVSVSIDIYYNLTTTAGSKLYGLRALLAFSLSV